MCEYDKKKAKYLKEAFPDIPYVFSDMCDLQRGYPYDYNTERHQTVPKAMVSLKRSNHVGFNTAVFFTEVQGSLIPFIISFPSPTP